MDYRDTAKQTIKRYARYCVDNKYQFDTYDNYRSVFYWIIGGILKEPFVIDLQLAGKYLPLQKGFISDLKKSELSETLRKCKSKTIMFGVIKAMFDIVIKDLKEESKSKESETNDM